MNDKRACERCIFWHREEPLNQNGKCRRYPPVVVPTYGPVRPTMAEGNFCGEWRDKSITPEQERRAELVIQFALAIAQCESDTGAELMWRQAEQIVDAMPAISHAICDGCNTKLPPNVQRLCPECAKTLDALSEYVKQRSEVSRER